MDSVPTNGTNTILTDSMSAVSINVTSNVLINSDYKKVRCKMDCYILDTFLLVIILLLIIAIICHHYTKRWSK